MYIAAVSWQVGVHGSCGKGSTTNFVTSPATSNTVFVRWGNGHSSSGGSSYFDMDSKEGKFVSGIFRKEARMCK